MSTFDFILPPASQTLAVSRSNYNSSLTALIQSYYGTSLPVAADVNREGTTGLVDGMWYRDSANGVVFIRDSNAFKGQSGHVTGNFTRVGIGTRIVSTLAVAATLAGTGHAKFSAIEVGELICTVGNSAGSANNRLYLRTANAVNGIADVSIPPDASIGVAKLNWDDPVPIYQNTTMANIFVKGNLVQNIGNVANQINDVYIGGAFVQPIRAHVGTAAKPSYTFDNDPNTGLFSNAADSIGIATAGVQRALANTSGIYPTSNNAQDLGGLVHKWRGIHAVNFYGTATSALYADLAERFEADSLLEAGDVVMLGGEKEITKTDKESTPEVFGVISASPAYGMNSLGGTDETHPYVALAGKVPVKVVGKVIKGQRLVASSQPGIAIAAETKNIFAVVGRALESSDELGIKKINSVVGKL